jgi:hypothetical protein
MKEGGPRETTTHRGRSPSHPRRITADQTDETDHARPEDGGGP